MTETTPTLLAAHDALVKALDESPLLCVCGAESHLATVVRDVATLAADETLVERVFRGPEVGGDFTRGDIRAVFAALAAALGGDRPAPTTEGKRESALTALAPDRYAPEDF